jgi:hypothetical protein
MGEENVMIGAVSLGEIDDNLLPLTCVILDKKPWILQLNSTIKLRICVLSYYVDVQDYSNAQAATLTLPYTLTKR